ncbi:hypothetical protein C1646_685087 [Rhizophagus diaphanus]|nr:hypothetical protein C1646_685087 [Rhizophagus diaphanus] [Rhizophagus sp. MUCL 43196]
MSNKRGSIKKSNSRSSSESSNNSNFDEQYRDASPISTTTTDSSDDDNGTARDTTPTTPTTPTKCSPIKANKELSLVSQILITSPHFPLPSLPSVAVSKSTSQRTAPASDNIEDYNHFRKMKKRIYWTSLELEALESGMKEFGTQWARILRSYGGDHGPLRNRNAVQLKDKARNEKLRRIKSRLDLGIFYMATGGGEDITEDELVEDSHL